MALMKSKLYFFVGLVFGIVLCNLLLTVLWTGTVTIQTVKLGRKDASAMEAETVPIERKVLAFHVLVSVKETLDVILAISTTWGKFTDQIFFHTKTRTINEMEGFDRESNNTIFHDYYPANESVTNDALLLINTFRRVCQEESNSFEWLVFVQSTTYVLTYRLVEFLKYIDSREPHVLCRPLDSEVYSGQHICDPMGFVVSIGMMVKICSRVQFCSRQLNQVITGEVGILLPETKIQTRMAHCLQLECCDALPTRLKRSLSGFFYTPSNYIFQHELKLGIPPHSRSVMSSVLMLSGLKKQENLVNLHYLLTNQTISELKQEATSIESEIMQTSKEISNLTRLRSANPLWLTDPSLSPPSEEQVLSDVINWHLFRRSKNVSYTESVHYPKRPMTREEMSLFYSKEFNISPEEQQMAILQRVDPFRGVDYHILSDKLDNSSFVDRHVFQRFGALRLTSFVEVVEKRTKVNFVISTGPISREFHCFMMSFESSYLIPRSDENVGLLVVIFDRVHPKNIFAEGMFVVDTIVHLYKTKYPTKDLRVVTSEFSHTHHELARIAAEQFAPSDLIFLGDVHLDVAANFPKKCRLNTVQGRQVYSPIVFNPYNPSKFHQTRLTLPIVTLFQVSSKSGFWLSDGYHTLCVYNSDLRRVVHTSQREVTQTGNWNVLKGIVTEGHLDVFRSVDPGLVHLWHYRCHEIPHGHPDNKQCTQFAKN